MKLNIKLKHKKMILGVTCGVMIVGLCALSIGGNDKKKDVPAGAGVTEATATPVASGTPTGEQAGTATQAPAPTQSVAPTVSLEKNANEAINTVINTYLTASLKANVETLKTVVTDPTNFKQEELKRWYEYVEEIKNVDCYTLPGVTEKENIVYVYYEMKIVGIDTLAPGLIQLYVTKNDENKYLVETKALSTEVEVLRDQALNREDVKTLISTVNNKLNEVIASDEKLKSFVTTLNQSAEQAQEQVEGSPTEKPADSTKPAETAKPSAETPATQAPATATPAAQ